MTDRPILFSAPMVRALIEGRKTQSRRVLKPQPQSGADKVDALFRFCPGDHLWVRETHAFVGSVDPGWLLYRASGYEAECERHGFDFPYPPESQVRWRPSLYMPRSASRLTLAVTEVRVERLQAISEADARAEGVSADLSITAAHNHWCDLGGGDLVTGWDAREVYAGLWNHINGPGAWAENPWVAALTFTVHHRNIDQMETAA